jgi:hypothetical protein
VRGIRAEDAELAREAADLGERLPDDGIERMPARTAPKR